MSYHIILKLEHFPSCLIITLKKFRTLVNKKNEYSTGKKKSFIVLLNDGKKSNKRKNAFQ